LTSGAEIPGTAVFEGILGYRDALVDGAGVADEVPAPIP
jgi:hypothetical protein